MIIAKKHVYLPDKILTIRLLNSSYLITQWHNFQGFHPSWKSVFSVYKPYNYLIFFWWLGAHSYSVRAPSAGYFESITFVFVVIVVVAAADDPKSAEQSVLGSPMVFTEWHWRCLGLVLQAFAFQRVQWSRRWLTGELFVHSSFGSESGHYA